MNWPDTMDSADRVEAVIAKQGAILGAHKQGSQALGAQYQSLHATQENFLAALQEIRTALPGAPSRAAQSPAEPPQPEPYSGEPGPYGTFLLKCDLAFTYSPHTFTTDSVKLAYLVAKLQGKVLSWAEAYLSVHPLPTCSYDEFLGEFKKTFAHPVAEGSTEERLLRLQQGNQPTVSATSGNIRRRLRQHGCHTRAHANPLASHRGGKRAPPPLRGVLLLCRA
uniref:DUF4939 domain-containing protein n=1 Tax=Oreochromis aureus TaxID=47969 RepID=A0AAZ1XNQ6_OREAU